MHVIFLVSVVAHGVRISRIIARSIRGINVGGISVGVHVYYYIIFGVVGDLSIAILTVQGNVNRFRISSIIVSSIGGISIRDISFVGHVFGDGGYFAILIADFQLL